MMCVLLRIRRPFGRSRQPGLVNIRESHDGYVIFLARAMERHLEQVGAARSEPNDCGLDAIVRAENPATCRQRGGNARYPLNEIAPCEAGLHGHSPSTMELDKRMRSAFARFPIVPRSDQMPELPYNRSTGL